MNISNMSLSTQETQFARSLLRNAGEIQARQYLEGLENKIDINKLYSKEEEVRAAVEQEKCPYFGYFKCLRYVFDLSQINSFCDVGCATGHLLKHILNFYPNCDLKGLEYFSYHKDSNQCDSRIREKIQICDLRDPLHFEKQYDIVNCTEVGEHIDPKYASNLMKNLIALSKKYIVLTWSKEWGHEDGPHQHLNPMEYPKFLEFAKSFGLKVNEEMSERFRFLLKSPLGAPASYWWAESITVFEK